MKRFRRLISMVSICTLLSFTALMPTLASETAAVPETGIDAAALAQADAYIEKANVYEYPLTPADPEWAQLHSYDEMLKACRIPQETLSAMSTEEVVEAVVNYPFAVTTLFVHNSYEEGLEALQKESDAFRELCSRSDSGEKLLARLQMEEIITAADPNGNTFLKKALEIFLTKSEIADTLDVQPVIMRDAWCYERVYSADSDT